MKSRVTHLSLAVAGSVLVLSLSGAGPVQAETAGRMLYFENCAACHGVDLEGQPDWRSPDENGLLPAPPHDETGHTWHHDDAMLRDYITRGGQAVLDDMGVTFTSGMPGFGSFLNAEEIEAILDYIKSTWPDRIQDMQAQRSAAAAADY